MTSFDNVQNELVTKSNGEVVPRNPLECYVLKEYFLGMTKKEDTEKQTPKQSEGWSKEYVVEKMAEEDKPSREQVLAAREERRKNKKEAKKDRQNQSNKRPITKIKLSERLCSFLVDVAPGLDLPKCSFPNCKMLHDVAAFLKEKPADVGPVCYVYETFGYCPRGLSCRFSGHHIDENGRNLRKPGFIELESQTAKSIEREVQADLRKRNYQFEISDRICQESWDVINTAEKKVGKVVTDRCASEKYEEGECDEPEVKKLKTEADEHTTGDDEHKENTNGEVKKKPLGPVSDEDLIKLRSGEKRKTLDWEGKTYLAPLTTVGNLPFRRLCKRLGADITCGEMALSVPLLQGHTPEWALLKKHHTEDFFGIQIAGCSPPQMSRVAQLIEERVDCDFVDINMGCPIDLIFKKGMGSGLMARKRPLENIVRSMSRILSCPLTIKMRTGIYSDKNTAHELFPLVEEWGASVLTLHGRSREQRYTRLADWDYVGSTRKVVSIPVFGNGDVMNYEDYNLQKERSGVTGIMLARGALIKPWVFTEIKEQRHWDIQPQERLDLIKDFCNYGMEHWGSDDKGVETTRRFVLEWMSFSHRYVPHGILQFPPQRINERAPQFRGRNELETLLASTNSSDWISITEMFLGKVRDDFQFVAKHKANSYS